MKQEYKIFTGNNNIEKLSNFWKECENNKMFCLFAIKKRLYSRVEWDYFPLTKYVRIDSFDNCTFYDEIVNIHEEYNKNIVLPKKQLSSIINVGSGMFYVKNKDVENILIKISMILDNMLASNCLKTTTLEEVIKDTPKEIIDVIGFENARLLCKI